MHHRAKLCQQWYLKQINLHNARSHYYGGNGIWENSGCFGADRLLLLQHHHMLLQLAAVTTAPFSAFPDNFPEVYGELRRNCYNCQSSSPPSHQQSFPCGNLERVNGVMLHPLPILRWHHAGHPCIPRSLPHLAAFTYFHAGKGRISHIFTASFPQGNPTGKPTGS